MTAVTKPVKPLGHRSYGSIGHLATSRLGPGDKHIHDGQERILTVKTRDKHDHIIVQEKLDGSNVAVAKVRGKLVPLTRAGYHVKDSFYELHHDFGRWVENNVHRFDDLLDDGERVCGEWIGTPHGTIYDTHRDNFAAFDIMTGHQRQLTRDVIGRCLLAGIETVPLLVSRWGDAVPLEEAIEALGDHGEYGADVPEGVVYRCERHGKVEFLAKWVRPEKIDGKYLAATPDGQTSGVA